MQIRANQAQLDVLDVLDTEAPTSIAIPIDGTTPVPAAVRSPSTRAGRRITDAPIGNTENVHVDIDRDSGTLWVWLAAHSPVKFTPALLDELRGVQDRVATRLRAESGRDVAQRLHYQVLGSRIRDVFSLGGDLELFREHIRRGDVRGLKRYARDAVDLVYANAVGHGQPITTISLVQGQALGGGFEAALAAHVIVAERSARMGLPEVLFNMFPGMGAYQLLTRRVSAAEAERIILSGRIYTAEELHALGIVDVLADDGDGESAVRRYVRASSRHAHAREGFRRALQAARPLERDELYRMADVWAETALGLAERDLETIDYLLRAQRRLQAKAALYEVGRESMGEA